MDHEKEYVLKLTGPGIDLQRVVQRSAVPKIISLFLGDDLSKGIPESPKYSDASADEISPKEFLAQKQPKTDVERIACLGYYLTHYRRQSTFKTNDLTGLNKEAAQPRLSNPSASSRNAVTLEYFTLAGGGKKQITTKGETLVKNLPDRDAARDALKAFRRKRKTRRKANESSAEEQKQKS